MTELQIRFWLFIGAIGYAVFTTWLGYLWRKWLLWVEYIIGALMVVFTAWGIGYSGYLVTWQDGLWAITWNFVAMTPVIAAQIVWAIQDSRIDRQHKEKALRQREVVREE